MAARDEVRLKYTADIADLKAKLASIPGITAAEARKQVSELVKSNRAMEAAVAKSAKAAQAQSKGYDAVARSGQGAIGVTRTLAVQMPDVISQMQMGTSASTVFAQQGLQVVQIHMTEFLAAVRATSAALKGPLGIGLAAAATAGVVLANTIGRNREEMRGFKDAIDGTYQALDPAKVAAAAAAWQKFGQINEEARLVLLRETGDLAALDEQQIKSVESAREAARTKLMEVSARWAALDVQRQEIASAIQSGKLSVKERLSAEKRLSELRKEVPEARARIVALRDEVAAKVANINATFNEVDARRQSAAEQDADTTARRDNTSAIREQERALSTIAGITDSANASLLDEHDRIIAARDEELAKLRELAVEYQGNEEMQGRIAVARAAVDDATEARLGELEARRAAATAAEEERAEREAVARQNAEEAKARAAEQAAERARTAWVAQANAVGSAAQAGLGMVSQLADQSAEQASDVAQRLQDQLILGEQTMTEAQKKALAKRLEAQQDAARRAFRAAKNAKRAEAAASTALAAINAIAQSPPPSPFGLIGAGIATAAGLAAQQQISSQTLVLHRGGFVDMAPDEVRATLRVGEAVANPVGRQLLGDDAIRQANAGVSPQPAVYAVSVYRHDRQVERWKSDGLRSGDPIARAIDDQRIVGHRSR